MSASGGKKIKKPIEICPVNDLRSCCINVEEDTYEGPIKGMLYLACERLHSCADLSLKTVLLGNRMFTFFQDVIVRCLLFCVRLVEQCARLESKEPSSSLSGVSFHVPN